MTDPAVIRLLHQGVTTNEGKTASAFPLPALENSPLATGLAARNWKLCEKNGLSWLEHPASGLPGPLYITGHATSSLDVARLLGERDLLPEWASVLTLSQSAGRGQMRRAWSSPEGNLYAAIRLPLEDAFLTAAAAPAIGALLASALHEQHFSVVLKWPNDLLSPPSPKNPAGQPKRNDYHKVGGILLEERQGILTAGIGLNTSSFPPEQELRERYAFPAGLLTPQKEAFSAPQKRNKPSEGEKQESDALIFYKNVHQRVSIFTLWLKLAAHIFSCYKKRNDPDSWWLNLAFRHLAFRGCHVELDDAVPEHNTMLRIPSNGILAGITPSGALCLSTEEGLKTFLGGSLLLNEPE